MHECCKGCGVFQCLSTRFGFGRFLKLFRLQSHERRPLLGTPGGRGGETNSTKPSKISFRC